ncbi:MAG: immunity protein 31 [Hyphomicrobiaceae bacterium]|nr:immunity protein 31 [Hyphomicrobiaceae bacterium]
MLRTYDIVVISPDCVDDEVAGQRGYVIGLVEKDQIGVFVYAAERVWCLHPDEVTATGTRDEEAAAHAGSGGVIRVSATGDVLD